MSVHLNEDQSDFDYYGFSSKFEYDRTADYPVLRPKVTKRQAIIYGGLLVIGVFWITASAVSGYHAWNEFLDDKVWVKIIRMYVAIIFSPLYLFYIFMKSTVFK